MDRSPICTSLAGMGGGMMSTLVCSPLDVAKTRLQVQAGLPAEQRKYGGLRSALHVTWREEGFRGLYRGLGVSLFSVPLYWGLYFPLYDFFKTRLDLSNASIGHPVAGNCVAAIGAGVVANSVTNPFWVVRTRMITHVYHHDGFAQLRTGSALRAILRDEGLIGLYRGLAVSFLGLSHVAIQFPIYEELKRRARERSDDHCESKLDLISASALSKMIASSVTYPHEVVRAHLFDYRGPDRPGLWRTFVSILRSQGVRAMYQGMGTMLARTVPACVVNLYTYECIRNKVAFRLEHQHSRMVVQAEAKSG